MARTVVANLFVVGICASLLVACGKDRPNPGPGPGPIIPPLQITTTTLPEGIVGEVYHAQIKVEGGTPPYALTGEGIPAGLEIRDNTLGGIPTASGLFSMAITAKDSAGASASALFSLRVNTAPNDPYDRLRPASGATSPVKVRLITFSPPAGSKITPTVGTPPITPGGFCTNNRCFTFEAEMCMDQVPESDRNNMFRNQARYRWYWSADGVGPIMTSTGNTIEVGGGGGTVQSGRCNPILENGAGGNILFPSGARYLIASANLGPSADPWSDAILRFVYDLRYHQ